MSSTRRGYLAGAALAVAFWMTGPVQAQSDIATPAGELTEQAFGSETAPVTVVEYASLTCHHCRDFHVNSWPEIKSKYVDTGKVRFIFREFPLDNLAAGAFMLARCSGDMKWYSMVDLFYKNDDKWAHAQNPLEGLRSIATQTGMTNAAFEACLSDQTLLNNILAVQKRGEEAGVSATPTFFINGEKKSGVLTPEAFAAIVDPLIAKAQ